MFHSICLIECNDSFKRCSKLLNWAKIKILDYSQTKIKLLKYKLVQL